MKKKQAIGKHQKAWLEKVRLASKGKYTFPLQTAPELVVKKLSLYSDRGNSKGGKTSLVAILHDNYPYGYRAVIAAVKRNPARFFKKPS